jgi:CheY-like chemotaxis protein
VRWRATPCWRAAARATCASPPTARTCSTTCSGASPRPALIVLDLELPRLRGLDAVRTIKSNQDLRRIPVVALTHDGDIDAVGAAYDAGINTYLAKPVTFLALVKLMKVFTAYWLETAVLPPEREAV